MTTTPQSISTTLYGDFPTYLVSQRANSIQATSNVALASTIFNSDYDALRVSWMKEVSATLVALGFWKGSA